MRVWLIKAGEPLSIAGSQGRPMRMGILARLLASLGHEVVWWSSTFEHYRKAHIFHSDTTVQIGPGCRVELLHSRGYTRSISVRRIIDHAELASKLARRMEAEAPPDIIVCSLPTLDFAVVATEYGRRHDIPVVVDIRDLWPDIFLEYVPPLVRPVAKPLLFHQFKQVRFACQNATALVGITPEFVEWGVKYAGRERTEWDRAFPLGYSCQEPPSEDITKANLFWRQQGVGQSGGRFVACFFGNMSFYSQLDVVIDAARKLQEWGSTAQFVLCGTGTRFQEFRSAAADLNNVIFPGWIGASEIWTLMRLSSIGLVPYRHSLGYDLSIPNKAIEYMSAGLPVVSSLEGSTLGKLLTDHHCGMTYSDAVQLAESIRHLETNPGCLEAMSRNSQELFAERFTAERVYGDYVQYLQAIVATRATSISKVVG